MDGLALFCNLSADGPVTLRRLRAVGVRDLEQLAATEATTLAEWLHVSLPQAQAFAAEARKLAQRIGESTRRARGAAAPAASEAPGVPLAAALGREQRLVPGLLPALDATLCARLAGAGVRTVRALAEGAGLALARRTGVPYSTLLTLARAARQLGTARASAPDVQELRVHVLIPERRPEPARVAGPAPVMAAAPVAAVPVVAAHGEPFALPLLEPESAGPFG